MADSDESGADGPISRPDDETVVRQAAEAAESVIFTRLDRRDVRDLDVMVRFEDDQLEVDVYLDVPADDGDSQQIAEDAALAARAAVDELLS